MSERTETTPVTETTETAAIADFSTNPAASLVSAADFANAESQEILNLLNDSQGGSCCGGSCCSV